MMLIRGLIKRVRRCAARRPLLVCTDGLVSYIRAIRETFRDPLQTATAASGRYALIAQVLNATSIATSSRSSAVSCTGK
jgi:hypothetical protein